MSRPPNWDIDYRIGRQGELWIEDIRRGLEDGSIEVKTDLAALRTGNVYIEHACFHRGREWRDSGIVTTEAEVWVVIVGRVAVVAPVDVIRKAHEWALRKKLYAECVVGSHPTKGVVIPIPRLLSLLVEIGNP